MPLLLGPLFGIALGAALAFIAQSSPTPEYAERRSRSVLLLFSAVVFVPICAYFASFWGDWAMAYLIDTRTLPAAFLLLVLVLDGLSVWGGFKLTAELCGRGFSRQAMMGLILPLLACLLFVVLLREPLSVDGSFRQVQNNFGTQSIIGSPLGYALLWMYGLLAAGFVQSALLLFSGPPSSHPPSPPKQKARGELGQSPRSSPKPQSFGQRPLHPPTHRFH